MTEHERLLDLALGDAAEEIRRLNAQNAALRERIVQQEARLQTIGRLADLAFHPIFAIGDETSGETD